MKKTILLFLAFVLASVAVSSYTLIAQQTILEPSPSRIGIFGGGQFNNHTGNFTALPGAESCCPEYTTATGFAPYFGLFYQLPIIEQLDLQFRGGYTNFTGTFRPQQFIGNALSGTGNNAKVVDAISEHYLKVTLGAIDISARASYYPIQKMPLGIDVGLHGNLMLSPTYDQHEDLIAPSGTVFSDSKTTQRNSVGGDIKNATSFLLAAEFGLHYNIPLSDDWQLSPEASFVLPFGSPADFSAASLPNSTWSFTAIRAGISLSYALRSSPSIPDIGRKTQRPYKLKASVIAKQVMRNNTESDIAKMTVEETLSKQLYPLLPYIFFEEGEHTIPIRYKNLRKDQTAQFNPAKQFLFTNTAAEDIATVNMDVYYHLLNIVGSRMKTFPKAEITLIGCNRNSGTETGDTSLSRRRALSAKEYLTQNWGIDSKRISIKVQNLPTLNSTTTVDAEDGHTENRRVEIESTMPEITEPLIIRDTLREADPPIIRYRMNVEHENPIRDWTLTARQPALTVVNQSGIGTPDPYYDFNTLKRYNSIPRDSSDIPYTFTVHDVKDSTSEASGVLQVEQLTIQKKKLNRVGNLDVNKYRLIMFDFNSDKLNATQNRIIDKYIREDIKSNSKIEVVGHTDRKGSDKTNLTLSENRAASVAGALTTGQAKTKGVGEANATYSNETPEGRMYNRTVEITVSNPIE
jgi:outer membrane protein OmpA-like peptidoglycan-associated protein